MSRIPQFMIITSLPCNQNCPFEELRARSCLILKVE